MCLAGLIYLFDQWIGIVAHSFYYLFYCSIVAMLFALIWSIVTTKKTWLAGLVALAVLVSPMMFPASSARLLRAAMLKLPPGTDADAIEGVVEDTYENSRYVLPKIYRDRAGGKERVHVSLLSQKAGDCTALIFILEDGVVARRIYSPD